MIYLLLILEEGGERWREGVITAAGCPLLKQMGRLHSAHLLDSSEGNISGRICSPYNRESISFSSSSSSLSDLLNNIIRQLDQVGVQLIEELFQLFATDQQLGETATNNRRTLQC